MRFEIDWASLIVGSKFTVFGLFYFVFEGLFWEFYGIWYGVKGNRLEHLFGGTEIIFQVTRFTYISKVTLDRNGVFRTPTPPPTGITLITFPT